jgi:demethylmenaquinone methyltransferase/2-methoxy-6-polyprenyl-1,4-benzoquinol methylase
LSKQAIIDFFDHFAPQWDADLEKNDAVIAQILDNAGIVAGVSVLDVACGTGVLVGDYLQRNVSSLTCVDISPRMIAIAKQKFSNTAVEFICADIETLPFTKQFDRIVVYNAFPHFFEPDKLIEKLWGDLKPGGMLTIAHGMSRASIDKHHEGPAKDVSIGLMHEDELAQKLMPRFEILVKISNATMYQVVGKKRIVD